MIMTNNILHCMHCMKSIYWYFEWQYPWYKVSSILEMVQNTLREVSISKIAWNRFSVIFFCILAAVKWIIHSNLYKRQRCFTSHFTLRIFIPTHLAPCFTGPASLSSNRQTNLLVQLCKRGTCRIRGLNKSKSIMFYIWITNAYIK